MDQLSELFSPLLSLYQRGKQRPQMPKAMQKLDAERTKELKLLEESEPKNPIIFQIKIIDSYDTRTVKSILKNRRCTKPIFNVSFKE